jgi:hypothetical protein
MITSLQLTPAITQFSSHLLLPYCLVVIAPHRDDAPSLGSLEQALLHRLASTTGRVVDLAYSALVHQLGITQRFFPEGFGELEVINFHEDVDMFSAWPPPHFAAVEVPWRKVGEGAVGGTAAYDVFRASFRTPATGRVYDALPEESRTARALWVAPRRPAPGGPTVLHLAATGDHGFARRQHLGTPLVAQGVGTLALESPFYGTRKPAGQQGAKLRCVSDLLLLGRATIEESLLLLQRFADQGHTRLGEPAAGRSRWGRGKQRVRLEAHVCLLRG